MTPPSVTLPTHSNTPISTKNQRKPEVTRSTTFARPSSSPPYSPLRTATPDQSQLISWSGPSEVLLGYALDEIGKGEEWWLDQIHPDDSNGVLDDYTHHLRPFPQRQQCSEARLWSSDYRIRRKDGSYVLVSERGVTTRDEAGYPTAMAAIMFNKDMQNAKRQAHKKELESRNYLSVVAENTPSGIFLMDSMGYVIFMNHAAEQITGFKLEELFDYTFHNSCHSCRRDGSHYPLADCPVFWAQQNGASVQGASEVFVHKDGHFYDIVFSVSPVGEYGSSGSVIEFRDVSAQRQMEQERLELQSAEKHKEAMASFVAFVCHEVRNPLQGITASAEFLLESMAELTKQLSHMEVMATSSPSLNSGGAVESKSSSSSAIAQLPTGQADTTTRSLQQLVENAKALIQNIQTCADHQALVINNTLDLSRLEAGKAEPLLEIVDILDLGRKILSMMESKASAKSLALHLTDSHRPPIYIYVDATMLSQVLLNLISNAIKFTPYDGHISLNLYIDSSSDPANASAVTLHGSVTDNGMGMTPAEQARLFQRFSQGNKKVSQLYGGSGLGLNISKEIVRVMGGTMQVESARGVGSTFKFTTLHTVPSTTELQRFLRGSRSATSMYVDGELLNPTSSPITSAAPVDGAQDPIPLRESSPAPKFKTIGIAEDNPINLLYLSKVITSLGYDHIACTQGEEMLTRFLEPGSDIDCLILDMSMPVMDGMECTRRIRDFERSNTSVTGASDTRLPTDGSVTNTVVQQQTARGIPIIALSGNALSEQVAEAFEAGVSDYLLKPTKKADLVKTLKYWEDIVHSGAEHQPMAESVRGIVSKLTARRDG